MMNMTKKQIAGLNQVLTEQERSILGSLQKCRYLTTEQIGRLHFTDRINNSASLRAAQRVMVKLGDYKLIKPLERRIGGVRAGSGSYVWALSEAGAKLLSINKTDSVPRKRSFEPSHHFLQHTLAISETYIRLMEICRNSELELVRVELEPESWRDYPAENGKSATLKPDMYAVVGSGIYEYLYFVEVDMATEAPSVVLEKCRRYTHYCISGVKQKRDMVLPLVVWIVPSAERRDSLKDRISGYQKLPYKNLFALITPDEFEPLIVSGAETLNDMKGAA